MAISHGLTVRARRTVATRRRNAGTQRPLCNGCEDGRIRMVVSWYEWDRSGLVRSVFVPAPSLEHDVSMGLRHVSMMS